MINNQMLNEIKAILSKIKRPKFETRSTLIVGRVEIIRRAKRVPNKRSKEIKNLSSQWIHPLILLLSQ
jgi:hypothetical protein